MLLWPWGAPNLDIGIRVVDGCDAGVGICVGG